MFTSQCMISWLERMNVVYNIKLANTPPRSLAHRTTSEFKHRLLKRKRIQFSLTFKDIPCKVQNNLNIILIIVTVKGSRFRAAPSANTSNLSPISRQLQLSQPAVSCLTSASS